MQNFGIFCSFIDLEMVIKQNDNKINSEILLKDGQISIKLSQKLAFAALCDTKTVFKAESPPSFVRSRYPLAAHS